MHHGRRRLLAAVVTLLAIGMAPVTAGSLTAAPVAQATTTATAERAARPNIVFVLMDDFSMELLRTMRSAREMRRRGASYPHSYVVDSLCCVSRSSTLTGQYPHQTRVLLNTSNLPNAVGPLGGWAAYRHYGNEARSVNVRLRRAGYTTGFVGKFLNQYEGAARRGVRPPGWSEWRPVLGDAYDGWGYPVMRRDGSLQYVAKPAAGASRETKDRAYAGHVIANIAVDFVRRHEDDRAPYFLHVSPYATHSTVGGHAYSGDPRFPPAFRDRPSAARPQGNCGRVRCGSLGIEELTGWGDDRRDNKPRFADGSRAPAWRTNTPHLTRAQAIRDLRNRARMAQSVDRMVRRLLDAAGPNTYVVLTSDNGFHLGQHKLDAGKATPYASDVRVPLLVVGPGVPAGARDGVVTNVDLAPTFERLAGLRSPSYRFGTSFADTLHDPTAADNDYAFFEHTYAKSLGGDPDRTYAGGTMDIIPSYVAVRDRRGLLVRVDLDDRWRHTRFAWEYYDYRDARFERTNTFHRAAKQEHVAELRARLKAFLACHGARRGEAVSSECRAVTR